MIDSFQLHRPLISIVMPIRGRTKFLRQSLGSVLSQDMGWEDMEILIQENPTESGEYPVKKIVTELAGERGRPIRYEANDRDIGLYPSTNRAIRRSTGQWIHILHDDDWTLSPFYSRVTEAISQAPASTGAVFTDYVNHNQLEHTIWQPAPFRDTAGLMGVEFLCRLTRGNPLQIVAVVFSREAFDTIGPFSEDLPHAADWEWWLRCFCWFDWWHIPEPLARFRIHSSNLTHEDIRTGQATRDSGEMSQRIALIVFGAMRSGQRRAIG